VIDAKHVTLTDFASALSLIDKNWRDVVASTTPCNAERQNEFALEELVWGKENASLLERRRFDIVIASDVVYQQEAHEPLVKTLLLLFERNPRLVVLVAHKRRSTVDVQFLQRLTRAGLRVRDLLRAPTQQFITAHEFKALDLDETFHLFEIWGTSTTTSQ
jgi:predicted nicotinamide N-methyase